MRKRNTIERIPKDTPYCNGCPYLTYRKTDYGFKIKGEHKEYQEYCRFLKRFLDVQGQVKDCGIGDINYE